MKTDVAVRKSTLPANLEKQMREDAKKGRARVATIGVSARVKTRGGILQFQDTPVPGNRLQCVILADTYENAFYEGAFDPENPTSPICFALGEDDTKLVPHPSSEKKQNEDCKTCENNKWGTADKGRGKACKNQVRALLIHADSLKADIKDAMVATLNVPPTSLAAWAGHIKQLDELHNKPIYGAVTEVGASPSPNGGFKLTFGVVKTITDKKLLSEIFLKRQSVADDLMRPYQPIDTTQLKNKKPGKKKF